MKQVKPVQKDKGKDGRNKKMETKNLTPGQRLWRELIKDLLDRNIYFDVVNNVLSFKGYPKEIKGLWLWFGDIRIAKFNDIRAGDMEILESYTFKADGKSIILNTIKTQGGN